MYYRAAASSCAPTHGCKLNISRSTFTNNTAADGSGAVAASADNLRFTVIDTIFSGNTALRHPGALSLYRNRKSSTDTLELHAQGTTFLNNIGFGAGALYTSGADVQLTNCTWQNNTGGEADGGGLFLDNVGNIEIDTSIFDNNTGAHSCSCHSHNRRYSLNVGYEDLQGCHVHVVSTCPTSSCLVMQGAGLAQHMCVSTSGRHSVSAQLISVCCTCV